MSLRERKKAETREAIATAAAALFREHGYDGTTTRAIAQRAGIATGTLFNYAPTKRDVVVLLWTRGVDEAVQAGVTASESLDDPLDVVCALFRPIFRFYSEDRELGRVYLQAVTFAGDDEAELQAVTDRFIARIAMVLAPHTHNALAASFNVFSAYFTALTGFLAGRVATVQQLETLFRQLVVEQRQGWRS